MKNISAAGFIALLFTLAACSPKGPYAITNKVYNREKDSVVQVIELEQPPMLTDSSGAQIPARFSPGKHWLPTASAIGATMCWSYHQIISTR